MPDFLRPALAFLPVACLLAVLMALDSYKLVRLRAVLAVVLAGMIAAAIAYAINGALLERVSLATYVRYVAPPIEEALKALVIVALLRTHRIGFLVDAAICGFAVGTGFALVENLAYLTLQPSAALGSWVVRGFGTAIMHGGASAILAVTALASARSPQHVGKTLPELRSRAPPIARGWYEPVVEKRAPSPFATAKTKSTRFHAG